MCLLSAMCSPEELLSPYSRYFWYPPAKAQDVTKGMEKGNGAGTVKLRRSSHRTRNGGQKTQRVPKQNKSPRLISTHLFFLFYYYYGSPARCKQQRIRRHCCWEIHFN